MSLHQFQSQQSHVQAMHNVMTYSSQPSTFQANHKVWLLI